MKFTKSHTTYRELKCAVKTVRTIVGGIIITVEHPETWDAAWSITPPKDGEWDLELRNWRRDVIIHFKANRDEKDFQIVSFESTSYDKTIIFADGESVDLRGHLRLQR